jgi:hypothetical protein
MFKGLINSSWFTDYRKYILEKILSDITNDNCDYCCHVRFKGQSFICWKDLKEVRETLQTTKTIIAWKENLRNNPNCGTVWFDDREQRIAFLEECLEKFNENKQINKLVL